MDYLFIDIGTYSIKFLKIKIDRGKILPINVKSSLILESLPQFKEKAEIEDIQINAIKEHLKPGIDSKIIYQIPSEYITGRFIQLPVANKNKAEMMIPFQLDEQLPYSISEAHYTASLKKMSDHFKAMICVSKAQEFESFYDKIKQANILPNILTTDLAIVNNFVATSKIHFPYAILDIGHTTTKAYFMQDGVMTSNHVSYVGGEMIDSFLSKIYNLPLKEAVSYKHKNCFFLTEKQFQEIEGPQKEFAYLIKQIIWPLVKEIRRWELGHRTRFGQKIEKYFIIGGTSNIKNITNFLSQALEAKVGHLSIREHYAQFPKKIQGDEASYSLATMMTSIERTRTLPLNMLHGKFTATSMNQMPLHSTAFVALRTAIGAALMISFFIGERIFFLSDAILSIDREVIAKLRSPALNLTQAQRNAYRRAPERVLALLEKKNDEIGQGISSVMASNKKNAAIPLVGLSQIIGSDDGVELTQFYSNTSTTRASFKCKDEASLKKIKEALEKSSLKNITLTEEDLILTLSFDG